MRSVTRVERDIESVRTEVVIQTFSDRVLVLVSQLCKVGTLIQASVPLTVALTEASPDSLAATDAATLPPVHPSIDITYLFGHAPSPDHQPLYSTYAAQVATLAWTSEKLGLTGSARPPVVVGVALKPCSSNGSSAADRTTFLQIMEMVQQLLIQD
ncbi:hypothetical protein BC834DRAFT_966213 [Gloeopeniophorella convolvens]|nr:hypothetical protein BC834DRAFT_966213 [Gloeopeniophorella convolvens]